MNLKKMLLVIVTVVFLMTALPPAVAQKTACDSTLWFHAMFKSFGDPTPPPFDWYAMHWEFRDTPYQVDYWWKNGVTGFVQRIQVKQSGRVVGVATNGAWEVCAPGEA